MPASKDGNFDNLSKDEQKQHDLNELLLEKAKQFDLMVVATSDSHYFKPEHKEAHEIMLSVGTKDLLSNPKRFSFGEFTAHLKSTQEMLDAFPNNPEVVYNSGLIAETCEFKFEFGKLMFPTFEVPAKHTQASFF